MAKRIMSKRLLFAFLCLSVSLPIFANTNTKNQTPSKKSSYHSNNPYYYKNQPYKYQSPSYYQRPQQDIKRTKISSYQSMQCSGLYMGAFGGLGFINGAIADDGKFGQGRLTIGFHSDPIHSFNYGLEFGLQSGNTMRLSANDTVDTALGGSPIPSTLKPIEDFLFSINASIPNDSPISVELKGGIAYRQLMLNDLTSSRDHLNKVNFEFQAGVAYNLNTHTKMRVFYQGIYGGTDAGLDLNSAGEVIIGRIPTQQGGFIGLEYSF